MTKSNIHLSEKFILETIRFYNKNNKPLSVYRLNFLLFLSDWAFCLKSGDRLFDFNWQYQTDLSNNDTLNFLYQQPHIRIINTQNSSDSNNLNTVELNSDFLPSPFSEIEKLVFVNIIEDLFDKNINDIISFFYSTYPMKKSTRYLTLNLIEDRNNYLKENK